MHTIGVRELKDSLSRTLALVAGGERVVVTSHGEPVAELVPPTPDRSAAHFHALVSTGAITPAIVATAEIKRARPAEQLGGRTASDYLNEDRAREPA